MATLRRGYVAVTVTLTDANTNYHLLTLINAVVEAEAKYAGANCPATCRELNIQGDAANNATNPVLVGDALIDGTRYGFSLLQVSSRTYRSDINNVNISDLYVRSASAAQKIHVEVVSA